jgi:hypothetical protein
VRQHLWQYRYPYQGLLFYPWWPEHLQCEFFIFIFFRNPLLTVHNTKLAATTQTTPTVTNLHCSILAVQSVLLSIVSIWIGLKFFCNMVQFLFKNVLFNFPRLNVTILTLTNRVTLWIVNQLDALNFSNIFICLSLSTCFRHYVPIIRRDQIALTQLLYLSFRLAVYLVSTIGEQGYISIYLSWFTGWQWWSTYFLGEWRCLHWGRYRVIWCCCWLYAGIPCCFHQDHQLPQLDIIKHWP